MSKIILADLTITSSISSYAGAMHGLLKHAGYWKEDFWKFLGLSGLAFHFFVHEKYFPEDLFLYDWTDVHFFALDRLGIFSSCFEFNMSQNIQTLPLLHEKARKDIICSINQEKGVLIWSTVNSWLDFGVIKGYDDEEGVFYLETVKEKNPDPLLYDNLGRGKMPILYYQILRGKVDLDYEDIFENTLKHGISEWKRDAGAISGYANGKRAYELLIKLLRTTDVKCIGLSHWIEFQNEARQSIYQMFDWMLNRSNNYRNLEEASILFCKVAHHFNNIHSLLSSSIFEKEDLIDRETTSQIIHELEKAKEYDQGAMKVLDKNLFMHS